MPNPYIALLRTAWHYARHEQKKYVFVYSLFIIANVIYSLNPILFGWFIGKIQQDTQQVFYYALLYAIAYFVMKFVEWSFHGPARIMEQQLAFNLSRNFLMERYHQALHLPVKWHQDHHSGSTINRIRKAYEALKEFFGKGFMYIHALGKLVFSVIAMLYFSPLFGGIGILLGFFTIWVIMKFDKPFIKTLEEVNEREHVVSSTLFDSLSNIMTVITLRLEKSMETGLLSKIQLIARPFRKNAAINEWKWFVADTMVTTIYVVIAAGYVYQNWESGKLFPVAGLVMLLGFVNQFTTVFHDVAWQYTEIIQYNTHIETARNIEKAYQEQHRPDQPTDLPDNWQTIEIKNLHFSHRNQYDSEHAPQSLHNLHLRIGRGKKIALIGESGSGK